MKKPLLLLSVFMILISFSSFAQSTKYGWLAKDSWAFGFGFNYPRYVSNSLGVTKEEGYGGYLSLQKNFSEHVGVRLAANFHRLQLGDDALKTKINNNTFTGDIDLLYYLIPCEPVSPFFGVGLGGTFSHYDGGSYSDKTYIDYQMNILFGSEFKIGENWKLKGELGYHTSASSHFDGVTGTATGGLLGGLTDSYMTLDLGFLYYFGYGEKSNICQMYEGLKLTDYDRIEDIVKKYAVQPTEVDYNRIEDIVKRNQPQVNKEEQANWVLIGTNFDFNKASIRPESYPILDNAAEILLKNPSIKVEIQGHTDNVGSEAYNQKLSLKRAEAVKNFLIAKGVAGDRLTTVGMGETKPAIDNKTSDTRALNRRIEFKIIK